MDYTNELYEHDGVNCHPLDEFCFPRKDNFIDDILDKIPIEEKMRLLNENLHQFARKNITAINT